MGELGIISSLGIQIIMKFVSGFSFRLLYAIRGIVGVILDYQCIVVSNLALGVWAWVGEVASTWIPPFFLIKRASAQKFWSQVSRVEVVRPRSALEFQSSRLHSQTHSSLQDCTPKPIRPGVAN